MFNFTDLSHSGSSVRLSPEEETNETTGTDNTPIINEGVEYYFLGKEVPDMSKRVLCLTLCLIIVFSAVGTLAYAQQDEEKIGEKVQRYQDRLDNIFNELNSISKEMAKQSTLNDEKLAELEEKVSDLQESFQKLHGTVQDKVDRLESLKGLEEYKDKIMELAETVSNLSSKAESNKGRVVKLREDVDQLLNTVGDIKNQVPDNTNRSLENQKRTRKLENRVTDLEKRLEASARRSMLIGVGGVVLAISLFFFAQ